MSVFCCTATRGEKVDAHATLNGIERLEVVDHLAPAGSPPQRTLLVRLFKPAPGLSATNVAIEGGVRIRPVRVDWAYPADQVAAKNVLSADELAFVLGKGSPATLLVVRTKEWGDYSRYTLRLAQGPQDPSLLPSFDPVLSSIDFSFKVDCPSDFDCRAASECPPEALPTPPINYLAKDYASFRTLMLDRMAVLVPAWKERHVPDAGLALVELLAYVGDSLSYQQDAVATEAYLGTARQRISVRRHARLVDYFLHEGSNARAWVEVRVQNNPVVLPAGTGLLTRGGTLNASVVDQDSADYRTAVGQGTLVFETLARSLLFPAHNRISFYTWGEETCWLPQGATGATLQDSADDASRLRLRPGDVLVLEEVLGSETGNPADADPRRRHAVRLTRVDPAASSVPDPATETDRTPGPAATDPLTLQRIVEVEWDPDDALPFPMCLSSRNAASGEPVADVTVARGNLVPADHGLTLAGPESLGVVLPLGLLAVPRDQGGVCQGRPTSPLPPRFAPKLAEGPLTHQGRVPLPSAGAAGVPFDPAASARSLFQWTARGIVPVLRVTSSLGETWEARRDLLDSGPEDRVFVAEISNDGTAQLRFGDGEHGLRPQEGISFAATYRVGNGAAGNVGAESIAHLVLAPGVPLVAGNVLLVRNPLSAEGGRDPESLEDVRQKAPAAFRTQERAVTLADYVAAARRLPDLQNASAEVRWTGSWRTVFVTPDPKKSEDPDPALLTKLRTHLERFRMAGYDLETEAPRYVPLEIRIDVCTKRGVLPGDVEKELGELFSSRVLLDGKKALFHPDRLTFGQTLYLSPLYQAALSVPGVSSVRIVTFRRRSTPDRHGALRAGRLTFHRTEIPRLDNDPNFPEHGVFRAVLGRRP
jgi:hypothetical protein